MSSLDRLRARLRQARSRLMAIGLIAAAAVLLSTVTVLGLRWAAAPAAPAMSTGLRLGFIPLDRPAPAVSLPSLREPGTVTLASLAGRPIVLNFWSSTCTVCKKETPAVASVARAMRGEVAFLGVDSADLRKPALAFEARYQVPYPSVFDPDATAATAYRVIGLPVTFFLSRSGRTILGENIGALTAGGLRSILHRLYGLG